MTIHHKRYAEPTDDGDGTRVLITRYRPRGIKKSEERWDAWDKRLAPSVALLDDAFGKRREEGKVVARDLEPIAWSAFTARYREEMTRPEAREAIAEYASRLAAGESITLLCYCQDASRCHRSLAVALLEEHVG